MRFSAVEGVDFRVFLVRGWDNLKVRLKQAVAEHAQFRKHGSAKDNRFGQWGAVYVLYHVREAGANEHFANGLNQTRPFFGTTVPFGEAGMLDHGGRMSKAL